MFPIARQVSFQDSPGSFEAYVTERAHRMVFREIGLTLRAIPSHRKQAAATEHLGMRLIEFYV